MIKPKVWKLAPFFIFCLLSLFFWRGLSLNPHDLPSVHVGKSLPNFKLPVLGNNNDSLTAIGLKGKVALLNVWASWCMACNQEQVFLMQLANEGLTIYGLNYKDNSNAALNWLKEWGNPYRTVGEDKNGQVAMSLGVYGAPETFLIDQKGVIRYRYAGPLTMEVWQKAFLPIIKTLETT